MPEQNPFIRAEERPRRLKLLVWGEQGVGKTRLALQFPRPVVIDLEGSSELYGDEFDFHVPPETPTSADDVMKWVDWLGTHAHEFATVVIDPMTMYWNMLQAKWSDIFLKHNTGGKGHKFAYYDFQPKDWLTIKAEHKSLVQKLIGLDMNVVVTARQKDLLSGDGQFTKLGVTYDAEKNLAYEFDTVIHLRHGKDGQRLGVASKDRSGSLPIGNPFDVTYERLAKIFSAPGGPLDGAGPVDPGPPPKDGGGATAREATELRIAQLMKRSGLSYEDLRRGLAARYDGTDRVRDLSDEQLADLEKRLAGLTRQADKGAAAREAAEGLAESMDPDGPSRRAPSNPPIRTTQDLYAAAVERHGPEEVDRLLVDAVGTPYGGLLGKQENDARQALAAMLD